MSTEPNTPDQIPEQPDGDISDAEREALLRDTLKSLQEAFSATSEPDDAETTTELTQNAADAAPEQPEEHL